MKLTRKQVIDNLSSIMDSMPDDTCGDWRDSLAYAISSLKIDEAYQIMYEGVEVYNKDTVVWMFRELQLEIEKMQSRETWCDYATDNCICRYEVTDLIQQKINELREEDKK